jgi:hypothetical protein
VELVDTGLNCNLTESGDFDYIISCIALFTFSIIIVFINSVVVDKYHGFDFPGARIIIFDLPGGSIMFVENKRNSDQMRQ